MGFDIRPLDAFFAMGYAQLLRYPNIMCDVFYHTTFRSPFLIKGNGRGGGGAVGGVSRWVRRSAFEEWHGKRKCRKGGAASKRGCLCYLKMQAVPFMSAYCRKVAFSRLLLINCVLLSGKISLNIFFASSKNRVLRICMSYLSRLW